MQALAENASPIRLGAIFILSGEGASVGSASKNGVLMAVDRLNAAGGVLGRKIEVSFEDDQGDPKRTIAAFRKLTEVDGIKLLIGPTWSNVGLPLIEMADRGKIIVISPTLGMAKFNESSPFLFNTWPHDFLLSKNLADLVFNDGRRHVALVGAEHVWVMEQSEAFRNHFEELGGKIDFITKPPPGTTDVRTDALKIHNNKKIDAVVSTTDGVVVGSLVAKSLMQLGSKLPIYSVTVDKAAIDVAGGGFKGLVYLTSLTPTPEFKREYEERFKVDIDIGAASAYDAINFLAEAIGETGSTDPEVLAPQMAKVKHISGVSGELTSDGKRGFTKPFVKIVVEK